MSGFSRWIQWVFKRLFSGGEERAIRRLKDLAAELGSQVGWSHLPQEQAAGMIRGEIALAAADLFGPLGPPAELSERQEARLRDERASIEAKIVSHQSQQAAQSVAQAPSRQPASPRWATATGNVVVISALIGLSAEAYGLRLGGLGYALLGLGAVLVLLNWVGWPAFMRNLLAWAGRGISSLWHSFAGLYLRSKAGSLDRQIARLIRRRDAEIIRRSRMDQWSGRVEAVVMSCFDFYKAKAEKAAEMRRDPPRTLHATMRHS
jgi:hypothetical protein